MKSESQATAVDNQDQALDYVLPAYLVPTEALTVETWRAAVGYMIETAIGYQPGELAPSVSAPRRPPRWKVREDARIEELIRYGRERFGVDYERPQ
jgi:hypothetical protein